MATITPESGGPDAPGETMTAHPIVTAGPGISDLPSPGRDVHEPADVDHRPLERGQAPPLQLEGGVGLRRDAQALDLQLAPRLDGHAAARLQREVGAALHGRVARAGDLDLPVRLDLDVARVVDRD